MEDDNLANLMVALEKLEMIKELHPEYSGVYIEGNSLICNHCTSAYRELQQQPIEKNQGPYGGSSRTRWLPGPRRRHDALSGLTPE